jgi:hypothetical protein
MIKLTFYPDFNHIKDTKHAVSLALKHSEYEKFSFNRFYP